MTIALDSNILVYAVDGRDIEKQSHAITVLDRCAAHDLLLTNQVIAEFFAVVRRKMPACLPGAIARAQKLTALFPPVPTTIEHIFAATEMIDRHRFQF